MLCVSKNFVGSSQTLLKLASAPSTRLYVKRIQKQISIAQRSRFHQSSHSNNPVASISLFRNYAQRQNTIRYRGLTTGTNVESKPSGTLTEQPAKASTAPIPQLTNPPPISQLSSTTGYIQYDLSTQSPHSFFLPQQNQDLRQPEDKAKLNFTRFRLRSDKPIHVLLLQIQDDNPHVKDVCVYTFDETSVAGSVTSTPGEQKATKQSGIEKTRWARSALLDDVIKDALKSETRKFELAVTYTAANGSGSSVKNIEVLLPSFHDRTGFMTEPLLELKTKLDSLSVVKSQCDALAQRSAERIVWGGLGALCLQFGLMARLTWWEYSWDVMEPISYFLTFSTGIIGYMFYAVTRKEYSYENVTDLHVTKRQSKLYQKAGLDLFEWVKVKNEVEHVEKLIENVEAEYV